MFFDNLDGLVDELRRLLETMVHRLDSIATNTEREVAREQRVTIRAQGVYDAAGEALIEIETPVGSSLEITKVAGSVLSGFAVAYYLNAVALPNIVHRESGGDIVNLGEVLYLNDGEKLILQLQGGNVGEAVYLLVQGKRYMREPHDA